MAVSKISSRTSMRPNIKKNFKLKHFGMNIDSSMIWLPKLSREKEATFGPAKTMMVMFSLILLPKVINILCRIWISWPDDLRTLHP